MRPQAPFTVSIPNLFLGLHGRVTAHFSLSAFPWRTTKSLISMPALKLSVVEWMTGQQCKGSHFRGFKSLQNDSALPEWGENQVKKNETRNFSDFSPGNILIRMSRIFFGPASSRMLLRKKAKVGSSLKLTHFSMSNAWTGIWCLSGRNSSVWN